MRKEDISKCLSGYQARTAWEKHGTEGKGARGKCDLTLSPLDDLPGTQFPSL